jgi:hypothetical protein
MLLLELYLLIRFLFAYCVSLMIFQPSPDHSAILRRLEQAVSKILLAPDDVLLLIPILKETFVQSLRLSNSSQIT